VQFIAGIVCVGAD